MEMLSYFRGDKHEFCLIVIKIKHVRSCPSFDITYTRLHRVKIEVSLHRLNCILFSLFICAWFGLVIALLMVFLKNALMCN